MLLRRTRKIIGRVTMPPIGPAPFLLAEPDGTGTGLVVMPQAEALPLVWAGPAAGGLDPAAVAGAVSRERSCPLLPEHGAGWFGRPGAFRVPGGQRGRQGGHRAGLVAAVPAGPGLPCPGRLAGADRGRRHHRGPAAGHRDRGRPWRGHPGPAHAGQRGAAAVRGRGPGRGLPAARRGRRDPRLQRAAPVRADPAAAPGHRRPVAARGTPRPHRARRGHPGDRRGARVLVRPRRGVRPARGVERQHRALRRADGVPDRRHRRRRAAAARRDLPGRRRVLHHPVGLPGGRRRARRPGRPVPRLPALAARAPGHPPAGQPERVGGRLLRP